MSTNVLNRMRNMLVSKVESKFNLTHDDSEWAVEHSVFTKMVKIDPEYVGHYSIDYWADNTYLEYQGIPTT